MAEPPAAASSGVAVLERDIPLADWARHSELPAGWLSLDAGDNDPARFWRHAVAALDRARPGIGERVAPLLGPPAPSSFQGLVTALINELAAQPDEALLVLDDYHVIGAQPVHESLAFLLEHRPAGRAGAFLLAGDLGARPAQRAAMRRGHRPGRQSGTAGAGGTGGLVRGAAG